MRESAKLLAFESILQSKMITIKLASEIIDNKPQNQTSEEYMNSLKQYYLAESNERDQRI